MTVFTTFAAGSQHGLSYAAENTFGTNPATGFTSLRHTSCSLILSKDTFQSNELRSDRQITDFRHGTYQVGGDIGIEFSWTEFDPLIAGVLCASWGTAVARSVTVAFSADSDTLYGTDATFTSWATGDAIKIVGTTSNDGSYVVTGALVHTLTLNASLVTEANNSCTITKLNSCSNGTATPAFTIERLHSDIDQYGIFTGCVVDGFDLTMRPNAMVTGTIRFLGKTASYSGTSTDTTPTASQSGTPYDTFSGALKEGGTANALITGIDLSIANNGETAFVIGSKYTQTIVLGRCNITGTVECFFQNMTMLNKFINETESSIEVDVGGTDEYYKIFIPRVKYGGADTGVDAEGPITMSMPFQALYSSTYGYTIQFTRVT